MPAWPVVATATWRWFATAPSRWFATAPWRSIARATSTLVARATSTLVARVPWFPIAAVRSTAPGFVTAALVVRVAAALVVIAAMVMLVRSAGGAIPRFAAWVDAQGAWAPAAYVGGYVVLTLAFVPGALPTMAAGAVFGLGPGTAYAFLGEALGGAAAFWLARTVARPWIETRLTRSRRFRALDRTIAIDGRRIVAMLRLSPAVPFNVLNYALGLSTIRFADYLTATLAMLPGALLYVYYGKLIGDVAALASGATVPHDAVYWTATLLGLGATIAVSVVLARTAARALREATVPLPGTIRKR